MENNYDLQRFVKAQQQDYPTALREIQNGRKYSHWMWYIFPQMKGLGRSFMSQEYGICGLDEAKAFLRDPYLGGNLLEISNVLLELKTNNAREVFGRPDDMKLRSCMTLFAFAAGEDSVFHQVLEKYFRGRFDPLTVKMLQPDRGI